MRGAKEQNTNAPHPEPQRNYLLLESSLGSDPCSITERLKISSMPGAYQTRNYAVHREDESAARQLFQNSRTAAFRTGLVPSAQAIASESTLKFDKLSMTHDRSRQNFATTKNVYGKKFMHTVTDTDGDGKVVKGVPTHLIRTEKNLEWSKVTSSMFTPLQQKVQLRINQFGKVNDIRSGMHSRRWITKSD